MLTRVRNVKHVLHYALLNGSIEKSDNIHSLSIIYYSELFDKNLLHEIKTW